MFIVMDYKALGGTRSGHVADALPNFIVCVAQLAVILSGAGEGRRSNHVTLSSDTALQEAQTFNAPAMYENEASVITINYSPSLPSGTQISARMCTKMLLSRGSWVSDSL